jgi:ketosteroid isomerase-like protein
MNTINAVIDQFVDFYTALDAQPLAKLSQLYHADATLIDPFGEHQGAAAVRRYFTHLLENVDRCRFVIDPPLSSDDRFMVSWTMHWSHPRIAHGQTRVLPGCSTVEVQNGFIVRQQDYYDAGEMIYEQLPVLGWAIRSVKRRVRA